MIKLIDILREIKVNNPIVLNFPIKIDSLKEWERVKKLLALKGYCWGDRTLNLPYKFQFYITYNPESQHESWEGRLIFPQLIEPRKKLK